ncbi:uncharacterized protein LOC113283850 [Papaver somniferum]|uniref:uncharacterized protein LOC113283850 n=1 Tax=Papaver somniferum TaxID=3469 RepID=UPI000E6F647C|nr:uncharacterized protein LOC113283850 [Papaver somniferum]XP_026389017.1 uncharacterized protein LOC113283850 [Papaver somniferum]
MAKNLKTHLFSSLIKSELGFNQSTIINPISSNRGISSSIIKQQDLIIPSSGFLHQRRFSTSNLPNKSGVGGGGDDNNVRAVIVTWARATTITPCMVGMTVAIHNGKDHIIRSVNERMVGHKYGEFAPTRTFHGHTIKGGNEKGKKGGGGGDKGKGKGGRLQRPKKTLKELLMKRKNVKVLGLRAFLKSKGEIEKKGTRWGT